MLSRCKKGMYICTKRGYIEGVASKTLVGKLASEGEVEWITSNELEILFDDNV
jgi:hypothetical protein